MIDFDIPAAPAAQRDEIRAFVADRIVPYETDQQLTRHGPDDDLRTELVALAREAGRRLRDQRPQVADHRGSWREDVQQCRLAIWWACWASDTGEQGTGRHESSMVKAYVSEELFDVADRCVQILGGIGSSDETRVGMIFSDIRAFGLHDGPTEAHKYAIARRMLR